MQKIFGLANGLAIRVDVVEKRCIRLRLGDGESWSESGLNRYGILQSNLGACEASVTGRIVKLPDGYELAVGDDATMVLSRNGRVVTRITEFARRPTGGFRVMFDLSDDERLYGLGDENRERLQKRGHRAEMVLRNLTSYIPVPYLMSTGGWAVLVNTTCYHIIDAGAAQNDKVLCECAHGEADIYLFMGESQPELLDAYTKLSGRPALLPRWAYGFTFVCDEREVRARDVLYEALEFRRQGIPCDVIGLEPDWMEEHYDFSVNKKFSEKRFHRPHWRPPNGDGTFAGQLHKMGFRLSLWLCCDYDLSEYEEKLLQEEAADLNVAGDAAASVCKNDLEPANPGNEVRSAEDLIQDQHLSKGSTRIDRITVPGQPWFEHLKKFVDEGADAFKLDGANQVLFHPDRKWFNGMADYEMHNLYPVIYSKQMVNGFKEYTGRRAMVYTPGGYAGIQQYSATWTGDTGGGARPLAGLLNLAMSGHSNGTCDLQIWDREGIHSGMLLPWSQLLGWHMYTQPWFQGDDIYDCFKIYAKLRYKLLPYIYASAYQANLTGLPMMRPMPLAFPDDETGADLINQYMLGDWLLVASFTNRIYLPDGLWYNYWTKERLEGGRWLEVDNPADWGDGTQPLGGPLFVRAGAIIPTAPEMLFSHQQPNPDTYWEIYALDDGKSFFRVYTDDGVSLNFEKGVYMTTDIECTFKAGNVTVVEKTGEAHREKFMKGQKSHFQIFGGKTTTLPASNLNR